MVTSLYPGFRKFAEFRHGDGDSEHVAFNQLWFSAAIGATILQQFAHSRPKLIRQPNLAEELGNHGIFWKGRKRFWVKPTETVRAVAVFGAHPTIFYNQFCGEGAGVFPVNQKVGSNFAENRITNADAGRALQMEGVRQVFLNKRHDAVIAFHKIHINKIPVVVAVKVHLAQNQVSAVMRQRVQKWQLFAQQQDASQSNAGGTVVWTCLVELGALEQLQIVHVFPWMISPSQCGYLATLGNQVSIKVIQSKVGEYPVFAISGLLALIQGSDKRCVVGDVKIPILVAVVNTPIATVNL